MYMVDRIICKNCGGWMESVSPYEDKYICDTCYLQIIDGVYDYSECED